MPAQAPETRCVGLREGRRRMVSQDTDTGLDGHMAHARTTYTDMIGMRIHPHGFGQWFIGHRAHDMIVLPRRLFHETTLRAWGIRYVSHGFQTRQEAIRTAGYIWGPGAVVRTLRRHRGIS